MSTSLLLDNWLLQDITEVFNLGFSKGKSTKIRLDYKSNSHTFDTITHGIIQIEALLNFLIDIVTRDILVLDEEFSYVWKDRYSPLMHLQEEDIIALKSFDTRDNIFIEARKAALKELCITQSLIDVQKENEKSFYKYKKAKSPFMSSVVWGTAGNLARSYTISAPYSPHPLRRCLLEQTTFKSVFPDAMEYTLEYVNKERIKFFGEMNETFDFKATQVALPPIAVEIIENSSIPDDLIKVALELRKEYSGFRKHVKEFQSALDSQEPKEMMEFKRIFDSVSSLIRKSGYEKFGATSISLGVGFFSLPLPIPIPKMDAIKSKFGIRATLQKLIFEKQGGNSLKKLLKMFNEKDFNFGNDVMSYFKV